MTNFDSRQWFCAAAFAATLASFGCGEKAAAPAPVAMAKPVIDEVAAERAKLSADDRAAVDAQEWCVIMTDERLGSMGPPLKLTIKGQSVYVCCKGCVKKAEGNPDKSIATLDELKAKKKPASSKS